MSKLPVIAKWTALVGLSSAALGLVVGLLWPAVSGSESAEKWFLAVLVASVVLVGGGIAGLMLGLWKAPREK